MHALSLHSGRRDPVIAAKIALFLGADFAKGTRRKPAALLAIRGGIVTPPTRDPRSALEQRN